MSDERLDVAVIGLGGFGRLTLQALRDSDLVTVVGAADRNPGVAHEIRGQTDLPTYTDPRQLLVERRPKAAYIAVPPSEARDLVDQCAKFGIHVWQEQPLGRDLDEGLATVRRMEAAGLKLAVGTQRRFAPGYRRGQELLADLGEVFLARGEYLFNWGGKLGWRGDRASAGGGALLELGYQLIDLLNWMLGLPEEVYGISACGHRPEDTDARGEALPIHDTDDSAAALLRYRGNGMASLVTTRSSGPVRESLVLHGRRGSLWTDDHRCVLRDPEGNVQQQTRDDSPPVAVYRAQAEAFARAVLDDAARYPCSGWENLLNLAVIDALYLSDRTSQAESPRQLLQARRVTLQECLSRQPAAV